MVEQLLNRWASRLAEGVQGDVWGEVELADQDRRGVSGPILGHLRDQVRGRGDGVRVVSVQPERPMAPVAPLKSRRTVSASGTDSAVTARESASHALSRLKAKKSMSGKLV